MDATSERNASEIAIIGMVCRFPGARDAREFWRNLLEGRESITALSDDELETSVLDPDLRRQEGFVASAPVLDDADLFDAGFFDYSPKEAQIMDPQQRLFLESAWEAMENAGYDPSSYPGLVGVFAGASTDTYVFNLFSNRGAVGGGYDSFQIGLGNDLAFLANRVSHKLDLRGPSLSVHTACSTSLVAVHLARQSLLIDECQMALAGAVSVHVPQKSGYLYRQGGALSPDGQCRPFDARAQGTLFGSGVGVVVMKRLDDALRDGDRVLGVLLGSAINNDGGQKASFTAPSVQGQTEVLLEALADAGVEAGDLGFLEAHGTGTHLGDPVEVRALTRAFRAYTDRKGYCALGSVKGNVGHLDSAAGMPGLFKAILALRHGRIPATLHFEEPNPQIDFDDSPFHVNPEPIDWPPGAKPRCAGVSSFGVGGTNAHLILEEPPEPIPATPGQEWQLLLLSARSAAALEAATGRLADHLEARPELDLADVAFTLAAGRKPFPFRRIVVARDVADAVARLRDLDPQRVETVHQESGGAGVVFLLPGGGAQYAGMGRDLYETDEVFRGELDRCAEILRPRLELDVREVLYPVGAERAEDAPGLDQTWLALPILFSVEYALARSWIARGVEPDAMIGHSLGEYVAACLAGVLTLEGALELVVARSRLLASAPAGAMLSVGLSAEEVRPLLADTLDVAADNAPAQCVVSGAAESIARLAEVLEERGVENRRLHIDVAGHSRLLEPILDDFTAVVAEVDLSPPERPYVSNVTGTWIRPEEATDPGYWVRHLRRTVRFREGIEEVLATPGRVLLEVGPGKTLTVLARGSDAASAGGVTAVSSVRHPNDQRPDRAFFLGALGKLWLAGVEIDWSAVYRDGRRCRVELPTYPFERRSYWIDADSASATRSSAVATGKSPDVADWFYVQSWKPTAFPRLPDRDELPESWLVFADGGGVGDRLVDELRARGRRVATVREGRGFSGTDGAFRLAAGDPEGYERLLEALAAEDRLPDAVVHLWSLDLRAADLVGRDRFARAQELGYHSLTFVSRALDARDDLPAVRVVVVSAGLQDVNGGDETIPELATLLGPVKVVSQESERVRCVSIDVDRTEGKAALDRLASRLIGEATANDRIVAYRGSRRWSQRFEPLRLEEDAPPARPLRERGVYLITGGMGGVGLHLGEYLARQVQARLVLVGRSQFPERERWPRVLEDETEDPAVRDKVRRLLEWEEAGAEVVTFQADVADREAMERVLAATEERFGGIHGVLHTAGVTSGSSLYRPFYEMGVEESEIQFGPKVYGTYVLADLLDGRGLDFCLLFSSNASVLGGLGYLTYSAANAFMDAFAARRGERDGTAWLSADWDAWPEFTRKHANVQTSMDEYTMSAEESAEAFRRVATLAPAGAVSVPTGDFEARYALWVTRTEPGGTEGGGVQQRPDLRTAYQAPETETEERLAKMWEEVLGLQEIGVQDNFFDLGGHSLLATRLVGRVREGFQVEFQLGEFFETPTVRGLAAIVDRCRSEKEEQEDELRRDILAMLDDLSDEEAQAEVELRQATAVGD